MLLILQIVLGSLISAVSLWGSIKLMENGNNNNTFGTALVVAIVFTICGVFGGDIFGILFLVALFMLLLKFYDLSFVKTIVVVILMGVINFAFTFAISTIIAPFIA